MIGLLVGGVLGVADRPGDSLDELGRGVVGAQVYRLDLLIEPYGRARRQRGWVCGDDDSWHPKLLLGTLAVVWWARHPLRKVDVYGGVPRTRGGETSGTTATFEHAAIRRGETPVTAHCQTLPSRLWM
jgi:hypothetical protein